MNYFDVVAPEITRSFGKCGSLSPLIISKPVVVGEFTIHVLLYFLVNPLGLAVAIKEVVTIGKLWSQWDGCIE